MLGWVKDKYMLVMNTIWIFFTTLFAQIENSYRKALHNFWKEGIPPLDHPDRLRYTIVYGHNPYIVELVPVRSINDIVEKIEKKEFIPLNQAMEDIFLRKFGKFSPGLKDGSSVLSTRLCDLDHILLKKEGLLIKQKESSHSFAGHLRVKQLLSESLINEYYFARIV